MGLIDTQKLFLATPIMIEVQGFIHSNSNFFNCLIRMISVDRKLSTGSHFKFRFVGKKFREKTQWEPCWALPFGRPPAKSPFFRFKTESILNRPRWLAFRWEFRIKNRKVNSIKRHQFPFHRLGSWQNLDFHWVYVDQHLLMMLIAIMDRHLIPVNYRQFYRHNNRRRAFVCWKTAHIAYYG